MSCKYIFCYDKTVLFVDARSLLRDCGVEFILDSFDVYYSVLHHEDSVTMDVAYRAYEDLHKGIDIFK